MIKLISAFTLLIALFSCQSNSAQNAGSVAKTIPTDEYQKLLSASKDYQLIDVRTPEEFSEGHLQGAVNVDFNGANFEASIGAYDKNKTTFIYCLSGGRSSGALKVMNTIGFKEVYNMQGGILKWKAANLPLSSETQAASTVWKGMTQATFDSIVAGPTPILVDFKAKWCGPCKELAPILSEIETEYKGKIKILPIDIDDNKSLAEAMKVSNIPLLVYYKKGRVILNHEGIAGKEGLVKELNLTK